VGVYQVPDGHTFTHTHTHTCTWKQLIGLIFIFIYALFGLQFFAARSEVFPRTFLFRIPPSPPPSHFPFYSVLTRLLFSTLHLFRLGYYSSLLNRDFIHPAKIGSSRFRRNFREGATPTHLSNLWSNCNFWQSAMSGSSIYICSIYPFIHVCLWDTFHPMVR
jgi:hypothetical protein